MLQHTYLNTAQIASYGAKIGINANFARSLYVLLTAIAMQVLGLVFSINTIGGVGI